MKSCIYEGPVRHRRFAPRGHEFRYGLFLMYVDLDELPRLFDRFWFWSSRRTNVAWLRRADHLGHPDRSLKEAVLDAVEAETGTRLAGPVRLLTHFRYLGHGFNPVSFYYCFDETGDRVQAMVCEVNNTPWGEQHLYVLPASESEGDGTHLKFLRQKEFHVSPFMPMDIRYDWRFSQPGDRLSVHMANHRAGEKVFDATLSLRRVPISSYNLARVLVMYPLVTVKVVAGIYFEALRLWLKGTPFFPHPHKKETPRQAEGS